MGQNFRKQISFVKTLQSLMWVASQERPIGTQVSPAFFQFNQSWILIWFQNIYLDMGNREYSGFVTNWSTKAYKAIISPLVTFSK